MTQHEIQLQDTVDKDVLRHLGLIGRLGHRVAGDDLLPADPTVGLHRLQAALDLDDALRAVHAERPEDLAAPRPVLTNLAQLVAEFDTDDPDRFATQLAITEVIGAHMAMAILDTTDEEREARAQLVAAAIRDRLLDPRAERGLPQRWRRRARRAFPY